MTIKELTLYTTQIDEQLLFYRDVLGLKVIAHNDHEFSLQVGQSILRFLRTENKYTYHYCFLIPSNKLNEAQQWLSNKLELIQDEKQQIVQDFDSWNAEAIYFYDRDDNILEFIVRHDLDNQERVNFSSSSIISINEIGMVTTDISAIFEAMNNQFNIGLWKGSLNAFAAIGDQQGMFIAVNPNKKDYWFPTKISPELAPFNAICRIENEQYEVNFNSNLYIIKI